ncbi:MAG TPA: DUF4229 domain-containing protein [Phycicoccus sp.]|nr:DUF4229 domain-containing protein [Phycicoccus sp.]
MLRYTLLRTLVFFGCLMVFWLVGLRGRDNLIPLVLAAALSSMIISFFALRPFRQKYSEEIAEKLQHRAERKQHVHSDEAVEDAEDTAADAFR